MIKKNALGLAITIFYLFSSLSSFAMANDDSIAVYVWNSDGNDSYGHVSLKFRGQRQLEDHYVSLWPSNPDSWRDIDHTNDNPHAANIQEDGDGLLRTYLSNPENEDNPNRIDRVVLTGIGCIKAKAIYAGRTYEADVRDEKRRADFIYHIKASSTQRNAIEDEWERLRRQQLVWFALGTPLDMRGQENELNRNDRLRSLLRGLYEDELAFNCASVVHHLLKSGGLDLSIHISGVDCPHGPIVQGALITLFASSITGRPFRVDDLIQNGQISEKIIYPDKISYMAKRQMVSTINRQLHYPSIVLEDSQIDYIYNKIRSNTYEEYEHKLGEKREEIREYLKKIWDDSPLGKVSNKFSKK